MMSESTEEAALAVSASIDKLSDIERKVAVEVPWDAVKGRLDEAYRELGHGVTVKGFRKGKVPRKMLEHLFGKHVNKEVAQRLVQDGLSKALADADLSPVSEPKVEDGEIVDGDAFRFAAVVQVVPELEPKDYFGVELKQRPPRVTDDDLTAALEAKRREHTEYRPVEGRVTQPGDVLLVDVMGKHGDRPISYEKEAVELGEPPREPLSGLAAKLTGISVEERELEVELDLPVPGAADAGKPRSEKARLLVTIEDVKQKVVPALDDELAKESGEAETLEGLRDVLRKRLLEADEVKARDEAKTALLAELLRRNDVPVVPALVDRHLDRVVSLQFALLGIDPERSGIDQTALKERARKEAEETVKTMLLLAAIGKKEAVEVHDADVEKRLAEIAGARGQHMARVRSEYEEEGRMETLKTSLREEKTLDLLISKANITIEEGAGIPDQNSASPDGAESPADAVQS